MDNLLFLKYEEVKSIGVLDVYDDYTRVFASIQGHDVVSLDIPKSGDTYLGTDYRIKTTGYNLIAPRLILRKKAKKRFLVCRYELVDDGDYRLNCWNAKAAERLVQDVPSVYTIEEE